MSELENIENINKADLIALVKEWKQIDDEIKSIHSHQLLECSHQQQLMQQLLIQDNCKIRSYLVAN